MQVRLTRKFAEILNGLDLRPFNVGEVIDLDDQPAVMLLMEGWALRVDNGPSTADDRRPRQPRRKPART